MQKIFPYILRQKHKIANRYRLYVLANSPFFKNYPYKGSFDPTLTDRQGLIDFELGIFYNRIPKAANSTIVATLATIKHGDIFSKDRFAAETKRAFAIKPSQLSHREMQQFDNLYKFTFVRNPYNRVLSAYLDKIIKKGYFDDTTRNLVSSDRRARLQKIPTFTEFLYYLKSGGLYADKHWAPQSALLLIPVEKFDFIGKVESLETDVGSIFKKLNGSTNKVVNYRRHATKADQLMNNYYCELTQTLVADLYHDDFRKFDYSKELNLQV